METRLKQKVQTSQSILHSYSHAATSIGLLINLVNIDPIRALIYAAVINAITSIPILFALLRISNDKSFLKNETNGKLSNAIGWLTFIVMGISVIIMFITWGK